MGIAGLVLGVISVVWACLGGIWMSAIVGIVGIILAAVGKKQDAPCSIAGLVLSIIGTSLSMLFYIACVACVASVASVI